MKSLRLSGWMLGAGAVLGVVLLALIAPGQVGAQGVQPNLWQGTAGYTIPIATPPGTNGVGPNLALAYSSDGGNDWLGQGWSLTGLGSIERLGPTYSPSPTYTTSDTYRLNLGGSQKLVYAGTDPSGAAGNYYRTQIESFLRIEYVSASNSWVVTDTSGTKFYFGQADATRQNNPGDTTRVFRWQLDKVLDPHGTFWTVSYNKDATNGDMYPAQIVYTQGSGLATYRIVDFILKARTTDIPVSYRTGAKITSDQLLDRIEIKLGGQLIRKYTLGHTVQTAAAGKGRASFTLLTSVTEAGADGATTLPATLFTYNTDANGSDLTLTQTSMTGDPGEGLGGTLQNPPTPSNCTYTADVNGDRLPDILVGQAGNYAYYPNLGKNSFGARVTIPNPPTAFPSLCNYTVQTFRRNSLWVPFFDYVKVVFGSNGDSGVETGGGSQGGMGRSKLVEVVSPVHDAGVVDMDGDGLADIVYSPSVGQWYWWRNLGNNQFADRVAFVSPPSVQMNDVNVRFVDMDADSLPDVVQMVKTWQDPCYGGASTWDVRWFRNTGPNTSGALQFAAPVTVSGLTLVASDPDGVHRCDWSNQIDILGISFADMNNDGLPDLVWFAEASADGWRLRVHYYPGQGGSSFGPEVTISLADGSGVYLSGAPINEFFRIIDMNGDGLPDVFQGRILGLYYYYPLQANGTFGNQVSLGQPPGEDLTRANYLTLADMNGDGFPDIIKGSPGDYRHYTLSMADTHQLLETARTPLGGTATLTYQNWRDSGTIRWVLVQATANDGLGQTATTNYQYSGGKYVGWPQNELRGYNQVKVIDPSDHNNQRHYTLTYFHQDDAKKGQIDKIEAKDTFGTLYSRTTNTYATSTPVTSVSRVDLTAQVVDTYDGQGTAKTARTDNANFDTYGQPRQITTSGTGTTSRVTTTDLLYNTSAYILNRPSHTVTRLTSATGTKISESWFDYDSQANGVAPTRGDLTRETRWLSGGTNPVVQHFYDTSGNRIGTIDARNNTCASTGRTLKTDYDTTYQTFPITETNALCQVISKTYWGINTSLTPISGAYAVPSPTSTL